MEKKTLAAVDSEYFALIMSAHEAAYDKIGGEDYVPVLPPPPLRKHREALFKRGA